MLMLLLTAWQFAGQRGNQDFSLFMLACIFLFMFWAMHIVQQFANSRARLMPGFCRVHATVAVAAALAIGVLLLAATAWLVGLKSVGLVGITMLLFGSVAWLTLQRPAWVALVIVGWMLATAYFGRTYVQQIVTGQFEPEAVGLLVVGAVISLLTGIRLSRLNEEMPQYERIQAAMRAWEKERTRQTWSGEGILPAGFRRRLLDRQMAMVIRHAQRAAASLWSRICRWQVGMLAGWRVLPWIGWVLLMLVPCWLGRGNRISVESLHAFLVFFPGLVAMGAMVPRTRTMSFDLCMPVDRSSYLKQLGAAAALGHFQLWFGMSAVAVLGCFLTTEQRPEQRPGLADVALMLASSALMQVWFFGLGVWLSRFRSMGLIMVMMLLGFALAQAVVIFLFMCEPRSAWHSYQIPIAGLFAIGGAFFIYHAYRCWLAADLD